MTIHEDLAHAVLDRYMKSPGAAAVLAETRQEFASRDFNEQYVARIGQTQRHPAYWPMEQVAAEDETPCLTFSEHGWGCCVEPHGHTGQHMYPTPKP